MCWKSTWKTSKRSKDAARGAGKPWPCLRLALKRGHEAGLIAGLPCLLARSPGEPLVPPRASRCSLRPPPHFGSPLGTLPTQNEGTDREGEAGCGRHPGGGSCLLLPASRAVGRCGSSPTSRTVPQDKDKSCCPFFPPASSLLFLAFTGRGNGGGKATARNEACRILPSAPDRASL